MSGDVNACGGVNRKDGAEELAASTEKRDMSRGIAPGAVALAYLGDCVIELWVRERLVRSGLPGSRELNRAALEYVTAPRQAAAMKKILPHLTEEETAIFRRGRNIGHTNIPKRATAAEYRAATGMEALIGWLRLSGREERIGELLEAGYQPDDGTANENN